MSDKWGPVIIEAAELKRKDITQYDRLINALKGYAERAVGELVASDSMYLKVAQGRAQALVELVDRLDNCLALEGKYKTRS